MLVKKAFCVRRLTGFNDFDNKKRQINLKISNQLVYQN